jgi:tripartite-type tricarboxylate transporter receptor subunit TctC
VVKETLGANLKIVSGYEGTATIRLALERGELDGFFNSWDSVRATSRAEVDSGEWSLLVQMTAQPIKELSNVPSIMSYTKDEEQRQLLRYGIIAPNQFARLYVLPPGVPADRARALEAAFSKTMEDREFLADAEKGQQDISPLSGAELLRLIREYLAMPESINARLSKILAP